MPGLAQQMRAMARNNAWSNHRLYTACGGLSAADLAAERVSFCPSILLALNHILIVDWYYVDALTCGGKGPSLYAEDLPYQDFADLRHAQADSDRALIAFCENLDETGLGRQVVWAARSCSSATMRGAAWRPRLPS